MDPDFLPAHTYLMRSYGGKKMYEEGWKWLEKAYDERDNSLISLKVEPLYDSIRSDARFLALLRKVGLE